MYEVQFTILDPKS